MESINLIEVLADMVREIRELRTEVAYLRNQRSPEMDKRIYGAANIARYLRKSRTWLYANLTTATLRNGQPVLHKDGGEMFAIAAELDEYINQMYNAKLVA